MKKHQLTPLREGYTSGLLSGLTWGIDTTLLAIALAWSPFQNDPSLLIAGAFVCSLIHIFFETIYMTILVGSTGSFHEFLPAVKSRGGIVAALGGLLGGPIAMTCYLLAIDLTGATITTTISATYPIIGGLLAVRLLREHTTLQMWVGMGLAVFGIFYSGIEMPYDREASVTGCLLALVTAIGWGIESVSARYATHKCSISPKIALLIREYACLLTFIIIAPIILGGFGNMADSLLSLISYSNSFAIVAIAACFGAVSMYLWYVSIQKVGAVRGLCMNVSYCVWTSLFAIFIFNKIAVSSYTIGGAVITAIGITIALVNKQFIGHASSFPKEVEEA